MSPRLRTCRVCRCTDDRACPGGCYWLDPRDDLCSACAAAQTHVVKMTIEHVNAGRSYSVASCSCGWRNRTARMGQEYHQRQNRAVRAHWQAIVSVAARRWSRRPVA